MSGDAVNADQFSVDDIGASLIVAIDGGHTAAAIRLAQHMAKQAWRNGYEAGRADARSEIFGV